VTSAFLYSGGAIARANQEAFDRKREGVDPGNLPCGYYRVRRSKHWRSIDFNVIKSNKLFLFPAHRSQKHLTA
jgi:hypothetical protein